MHDTIGLAGSYSVFPWFHCSVTQPIMWHWVITMWFPYVDWFFVEPWKILYKELNKLCSYLNLKCSVLGIVSLSTFNGTLHDSNTHFSNLPPLWEMHLHKRLRENSFIFPLKLMMNKWVIYFQGCVWSWEKVRAMWE